MLQKYVKISNEKFFFTNFDPVTYKVKISNNIIIFLNVKLMKKFTFLGLLILLSLTKLTGQEKTAGISFQEEKYDFGTIKETDGPASHVFDLVNIGGTPLIINNVQASCGCTTPDWSKQPIPPGGKGFVKATFNPSGRPGPFTKTITVTSNASNKPTCIVTITGIVTGKPKSVEEQYPFPLDSLRFRSSHLGFQSLNPGMIKTDSIPLYKQKPFSGKDSISESTCIFECKSYAFNG